MKKFLSTFLVMCIILSVSGCVSSNNNDENGEKMNEEQAVSYTHLTLPTT